MRILIEKRESPSNIINQRKKLKVKGSVSGKANLVTVKPIPPNADAMLPKKSPQNIVLLRTLIP